MIEVFWARMAPHYVLFEHAAGYGLFRVQEFEEVATFLPQVEEAVTDVSKFSSVSLGFGSLKFRIDDEYQ